MNFWEDKNVFLTGADGFIGSWVAKALVDRKANVFIVARDHKRHSVLKIHGLDQSATIIWGDIIDYNLMERIINEYEIDTVFHLAAQPLVGAANRSPLSTFESNIKGTWNVLEACRVSGKVERIVVASSDKAYGVQEDLPYKEDARLEGRFPYDASKACTDILAQSYYTTYGLPIAITRNGNTYGGGDLHLSRIVPGAMKALYENKPLLIRSDGTPERDYFYVVDAAESYLLLGENLHREEIQGEAFNFGTERPISVKALFEMIVSLSGKEVDVQILGEASHEIDRQYLSIDKARRLLNWEPRYSLEDGLKETLVWYEAYLKGTTA